MGVYLSARLKAGSPQRSGDDHSRCSSSEPRRVESYEFRRPVWDRALPTKFRRGADVLHDSAASSVIASNSFSMSRTSGSLFAAWQASTKILSRSESFSLSALARYFERSRAGTRLTNWDAKSSGKVNVIFRVAILPYYHIRLRTQGDPCHPRRIQKQL